ncbi:MAG: DUF2723 domain-containing protein [bacterium]
MKYPFLPRKSILITSVTCLILLVTLLTIPPTVFTCDSGELISSAFLLGIAHPPGYPLWVLLGKAITIIPFGTVAFRLNLLSTIFFSSAILFTCFIVEAIFKDKSLVPHHDKILGLDYKLAIGLIFCPLLILGSNALWSQTNIAEVYSLNLFFISLILFLALKWQTNQLDIRPLVLLFFILSLGAANHHTIILIVPIIILFLVISCKKRLLEPRLLGVIGFMILLGLSVYLYLPLRSSKRPMINWGTPETITKIINHISRKSYGTLNKNRRSWGLFLRQIQFYIKVCLRQFPFYIIWLCLPGIWFIYKKNKPFFLLLTGIFLFTSLGFIYLINFKLSPLDMNVNEVFYLPSYLIIVFFVLFGIFQVLTLFSYLNHSRVVRILFIGILVIILGYKFFINFLNNNQGNNRIVYNYCLNLLRSLEKNALFFSTGDNVTFPLAYLQLVERERPDIVIHDRSGDLFVDGTLSFSSSFVAHRSSLKRRREKELDFEYECIKSTQRPVYYNQFEDMDSFPWLLESRGLVFKVIINKDSKKEEDDPLRLYYPLEYEFISRQSDYWIRYFVISYYCLIGQYRLNSLKLGNVKNPNLSDKEFDIARYYGFDNERVLNNIGVEYAKLELFEKAEEFFKQAIHYSPYSVGGYLNLANLYKLQDKKAEVLETYEKGLRLNPDELIFYKQLAQLYFELKDFQKALFNLNKYLLGNPQDQEALDLKKDIIIGIAKR